MITSEQLDNIRCEVADAIKEAYEQGAIDSTSHNVGFEDGVEEYGYETANGILKPIEEMIDSIENPLPLTLEQLKERVGMPVWIKIGEYTNSQCRVVVRYIDDISESAKRFLFTDGAIFHVFQYGIDWLAYDHKPKGEK